MLLKTCSARRGLSCDAGCAIADPALVSPRTAVAMVMSIACLDHSVIPFSVSLIRLVVSLLSQSGKSTCILQPLLFRRNPGQARNARTAPALEQDFRFGIRPIRGFRASGPNHTRNK